MTSPILTIVTVCFNAEATLREAISSVAHRPGNVEYIVIDGGSADGTLEILQQHAEFIDVLISERDNGIFDAMNKGFQEAKGDYVAYLNADDSYVTGALERLVRYLEQPQAADVIYGDWVGVDQFGIEHYRTADHKFRGRHRLCHQAVFARRAIFPTPPFDPRYKLCADFDLLLRWQQEGRRFERFPQTLVNFSETGASAKLMQQSARESISVALGRAQFPWAQLFAVRVVFYVVRAALRFYLRR